MAGLRNYFKTLLYTFIVMCYFAAASKGPDWSYKGDTGPDHWHILSYQCEKGKSQSPININTDEGFYDEDLGPIKFSSAYNQTVNGGKFDLKNNGHTVKLTPQGGGYTIMLGGLPGIYKLAQFHFHWGSVNGQGSEHTINGERYPLEAHFVHVNMRYDDINEALGHSDGLAVIGIMFKPCSEQDNRALSPITEALNSVVSAGSNTSIGSFPLLNILGKDFNFQNYYRYNGSLTTPECQESVIWTVYHSAVDISCNQMEMFRNLKASSNIKLVDNFRPVQLLRNRKVLRSFEKKCSNAASNIHGIWGYHGGNGPSTWKQHFQDCGGEAQSPINIVMKDVPIDKELVPFVLSDDYGDVPEGNWQLHNDGHTVKVIPSSGEYNISKGNAPGRFTLTQFHFHWGLDDERGSEHSINGEYYPMEMHLVHYNTRYPDLKEAIRRPDGLAVLAFMFETGEEENKSLQPIVKKLHSVISPGSHTKIVPINLLQLMGGKKHTQEYYRYHGSLTTPACHEVVLWTIYYSPIKISDHQMAQFRKLKGHGDKLGDNFRPVQPLYGRHVKRNFKMLKE